MRKLEMHFQQFWKFLEMHFRKLEMHFQNPWKSMEMHFKIRTWKCIFFSREKNEDSKTVLFLVTEFSQLF